MIDRPFALLPALGLFGLASAILAWPWLSGAVTIPWDAKSQFLPQVAFLARSFAEGQSPFWSPNVYAGWPQISDPQSLIFSPLHTLLALLDTQPSFRAVDAVTFAFLVLGGAGIILFFRDRGWHLGGALVAALAFAFGGSCASRIQHTGQIESIAFLPLTLWLLARALERSSWLAGIGAGLMAGLVAIGRDQVALLALYVLAGFVIAHWLGGQDRPARIRASIKPLAAGAAAGLIVAAVPVVMTLLLAARSNRPEIGLMFAGRGSLPPATLLMLALPGLFGAGDFRRDYWGPPSFDWHEAWGQTDLFVAQNVGQIYAGAILAVVIFGFGLARGLMWSREIRYFSIAAVLVVLYAVGWYTPAFGAMYTLLPGVTLFRRPADATFVLGVLLAVITGYLVHRWLSGTVPSATRWQRALEIAFAALLIGAAIAVAHSVGKLQVAMIPLLSGVGWAAAAIAVLALARRVERRPLVAALVLVIFTTADLAWNVGPDESTGLSPAMYEALRSNTNDETVHLIQARLAATAAPDRRDRVELIGIAYHWPNIGLIHGFDHVFGHNPLRLRDFNEATGVMDTVAAIDQRPFTPLYPSYRSALADLLGLRVIATGVPVEQIDTSLQPDDLKLFARTLDAYLYENTRALPRVMMVAGWQRADFAALIQHGGWPVDPRRTVLLERPPPGLAAQNATAGTARILRYANTEIDVAVESEGGGILLLNDVWDPWWRAQVDGAPAEILKANVLFRAVVVAPGRHLVRFEYHPFAGAITELWEKLGLSGASR